MNRSDLDFLTKAMMISGIVMFLLTDVIIIAAYRQSRILFGWSGQRLRGVLRSIYAAVGGNQGLFLSQEAGLGFQRKRCQGPTKISASILDRGYGRLPRSNYCFAGPFPPFEFAQIKLKNGFFALRTRADSHFPKIRWPLTPG
jgi:hypothetical protein